MIDSVFIFGKNFNINLHHGIGIVVHLGFFHDRPPIRNIQILDDILSSKVNINRVREQKFPCGRPVHLADNRIRTLCRIDYNHIVGGGRTQAHGFCRK